MIITKKYPGFNIRIILLVISEMRFAFFNGPGLINL